MACHSPLRVIWTNMDDFNEVTAMKMWIRTFWIHIDCSSLTGPVFWMGFLLLTVSEYLIVFVCVCICVDRLRLLMNLRAIKATMLFSFPMICLLGVILLWSKKKKKEWITQTFCQSHHWCSTCVTADLWALKIHMAYHWGQLSLWPYVAERIYQSNVVRNITCLK